MIRGLCRDSLLPWCIIGDFNELAREEDKKGGAAHPPWVNKGLREIISDCSLQDSGLECHLLCELGGSELNQVWRKGSIKPWFLTLGSLCSHKFG